MFIPVSSRQGRICNFLNRSYSSQLDFSTIVAPLWIHVNWSLLRSTVVPSVTRGPSHTLNLGRWKGAEVASKMLSVSATFKIHPINFPHQSGCTIHLSFALMLHLSVLYKTVWFSPTHTIDFQYCNWEMSC